MSTKKGFNRRDFLKVIGAGTGLAASGCATEIPEKLIPYVVQPDEVVPGNALWYTGTCNECSSGCGVLVRTREGRALKVEGNPKHPVNRGGLCALGQSSVQALYNPDRIREPLSREIGKSFSPISWQDSIDLVAKSISESSEGGKRTVFFTRPLQPTEKTLLEKVTSKVAQFEHIEYELFSDMALRAAAETVYGAGARTHFDFSAADVVLGVGADYLETWVSPVKFSKDFASRRTPEKGSPISSVYHIEPRLSLTAANADTWIKNAPRTEASLLKAVLYEVSRKKQISGPTQSAIGAILEGFDLAKALEESEINTSLFTQLVKSLVSAKNSLVVAGGAGTSAEAKEAALLALLLNEVLGNVGTSVLLSKESETTTFATPAKIASLVADLKDEKVGTIVFLDTNPCFSLPVSSEFSKAIVKASTVVSISTSLDETAKLSTIVLPLSTSFESWGDSEPLPGIFALNQPAMQPLFKTQGFGDILLSLDASSEYQGGTQFQERVNYLDILKDSWKAHLGSSNFEAKWQKVLHEGGHWEQGAQYETSLRPDWDSVRAVGVVKKVTSKKSGTLTAIAYPTVRFHDGRGANRPWMQEIPDPMSTAVWGSWVEIHPDTASKYSIKKGDVIQIRSAHGAVEAPAYITRNIHPSTVAIPIGQGHEGYGRYASGVGANPLTLLPFNPSDETTVSLLAGNIEVRPSIAKDKLVALQYSDTQYKRGFIRSVTEKEFHNPEESHGHDGHHNPLKLGPRKEPKQMYKQMEHPLYRWGMNIDLSSCTGCSACVAACYAENNVPVVGKQLCDQGREMSWIHISRYFDGPEEHPVTGFAPMLCQHCSNAPCEPVCPVYATYHAEDGLNTMVYNRCVGTRYCSNNCSYKVRRFNWFNYEWPEPLNWQLNPDVTVRSVGVMEKCSFCIQRIREGQNTAKDEGREIRDGEVVPACASSCPTEAITFGNLLDKESVVAKGAQSKRGYKVLDFELNTQPAITYLAKVTHIDLEPSDKDHHSDDDAKDSSHSSADKH